MTTTPKCKWKTTSSNSLFIINKNPLMKRHKRRNPSTSTGSIQRKWAGKYKKEKLSKTTIMVNKNSRHPGTKESP